MDNKQLPDWILKARNKWEYRGKHRPPFAEISSENQISVWDFPRPPAIKSVPKTVSVFDHSLLIAQTSNCLMVLETANPPTYYFPACDVNFSHLIQLQQHSWCEWKGKARYWALKQKPDIPIAWDYPSPFTEYKQLAFYVSFYPHSFQCFVGDEQITPQKSQVYAGWITKNLVGPFKGKPGSEHW